MKQSIHVKAPGNWLNDPNGFIFYKGMYHLFFQHNPNAPVWATMHWGHAVSRDLVHWEHLGIALYPSVTGDRDGCFSGSAVEKDGVLHLFYTGIRYVGGTREKRDLIESTQLHISSEDGVHFDNENGKQVIIPPVLDPEQGDKADTRDPKVWKTGDHWNMVLGTTDHGRSGMLSFYRSEDLEHWTFVNSVSGREDMGWMWECPDVFPVENEYVLIVSPMKILLDGYENENHSICMPVAFDEELCSLQPESCYQYMDYGLDCYAPQSTTDEEGRRVLVAWVRMPQAVDGAWNGMITTPRVVTCRDRHVRFQIHPNIRKTFSRPIQSPLQAQEGQYLLKMCLAEGQSANIGGFVLTRRNDRLQADRSAVYVDKPDARLRTETPFIREGDLLEIIVDPNFIEVFINDGEYVLSNVVYGLDPGKFSVPEDSGAELYTLG